MTDDASKERVEAIRADLQRGLEFHATSFGQIDEKAKYWLTVSLPSLFGLAGYGFQTGQALSPYVVSMICAVSVCLLVATYFLAGAIGAATVSAGVVIPEDKRFDSLLYFVDSAEHWSLYETARASMTFNALVANETQNGRKGAKLLVAEALLFRGVPGATVGAAVCTALLNARVTQWGWTGLTAGIVTGVGVGIATAAASWAFAHFRTPKN